MNCSYCHNMSLIKNDANVRNISEKDFFDYLKRRVGLVDAVVVSGGEPTLQKDLKAFIQEVKNMGFLVKLDTNGTNPGLLKELVSEGLIDYVAMDIKAPEGKYKDVCGVPVNMEKIKESIAFLKEQHVSYEFRTTYTHELNQADLLDITKSLINGAQRYVLQQYRDIDEVSGLYTGNNKNRRLDVDTLQYMSKDVRVIDARGEFVFVDEKEQLLSKDSLFADIGKRIEAGAATPEEVTRFNEIQADSLTRSVEAVKENALDNQATPAIERDM